MHMTDSAIAHYDSLNEQMTELKSHYIAIILGLEDRLSYCDKMIEQVSGAFKDNEEVRMSHIEFWRKTKNEVIDAMQAVNKYLL